MIGNTASTDNGGAPPEGGVREIRYPLRDRNGKVVATHVRKEIPGGKEVKWRGPNGEWTLNGTKIADLPLYGIHELHPDVMLTVVTEGEKARDRLEKALREAGYPREQVGVVGSVTGASGTPSPEALEDLRDLEVVLWPDADEPGSSHMRRVAERLQGVAAKVRVFDWPESPEKGDAADHPAVISGDEKAMGRLLNDLCCAPEYEPPEPEKPERKASDHRPDPEFRLTDTGNAERLVARHGEDLRYVHAWSRWLVWTGKNWEADDTGAINRRAKDTVRAIYGEAQEASDSSIRRELAGHATKCEAESRLRAMIALAQSEEGIPVRIDDLDADPWILNVRNGTIDLKTGELREHRREDLITKIAPVEYDPDAKAPAWEAFLERILPSEAIRRFVQRIIGYSLTGDVSAQILPFLHGLGANGKSTLVNTTLEMLGDYGQLAAPELLLSKRGAHPTELADLKGARLVASVEIEDGRKMAESLVKQLTGGEKVKARYLHKDFFEFDPTHKVFLVANHKPEVLGTDFAIWRRVKLIPFDVTIPEEEQDPRLPEKLQAELPGILAWAVRGCLDWQRDGLAEPEEVKAATEAYRAEMDVLADFINERCVVRDGVWCIFADLYESYEVWCEESGETPEKKRKFGARLKERGFLPANGTKNVAIRKGIALRSDQDPSGPGSPGDEAVNQPAQKVNPKKTCKSQENSERVNQGYSETENFGLNPSTRVVSEKQLTKVNSLTPEPLPDGGSGNGRASEEFAAQAHGEVSRSGSGPAKALATYLEKPSPQRLEYLTKAVLRALDRDTFGWERFAGAMQTGVKNRVDFEVF